MGKGKGQSGRTEENLSRKTIFNISNDDPSTCIPHSWLSSATGSRRGTGSAYNSCPALLTFDFHWQLLRLERGTCRVFLVVAWFTFRDTWGQYSSFWWLWFSLACTCCRVTGLSSFISA